MAAAAAKREQDHEKTKNQDTLLAVLKHPLRTTILDTLNEKSMSPSQFVEAGYMPAEFFKNYQQALSLASYHFRGLEGAGCLEIIETIPRRGAVEHVYKGTSRVFFSDGEFESLAFEERQKLSTISFQGVTARTERAIRLGTFDSRPDRHLTWRAAILDPKGFDDLLAVLANAFNAAEEIRKEAAARLTELDTLERDGIPVTFSMLGYESPPMEPYEIPEEKAGK